MFNIKTEILMAGNNIGSSVKKFASNLIGLKPATKEDHTEFDGERRTSILVKGNKFKNVTLEEFELKAVIGRGTFGKVFLAEFSRNKQ